MFTSPSKGRGLVAVPLLAILPIIFVVLLGEPPAKTRAQNAAAAKPPDGKPAGCGGGGVV